MFNVPASARQARLRSVAWQPNSQKKQNQENFRSSFPFSFSPCSLIKSTKTVSEMLARRAIQLGHHDITVCGLGVERWRVKKWIHEGIRILRLRASHSQ